MSAQNKKWKHHKKLFFLIGSLTIVVLLGILAGYHAFFSSEPTSLLKNTSETLYTCPMHPQLRLKHPGQCPICGMTLIPIPKTPKKTSSKMHMNMHQMMTMMPKGRKDFKSTFPMIQKIGVKTFIVKKKKLFRTIYAPAKIAFDPELYTVEKEYIEALRQWEKVSQSPLEEVRRSTQEMIQSAKLRLKVLGLTNHQIQLLTKRKKHLESLLVSDHSRPWIYAELFESDLPYIAKDLSVHIFSAALGPHLYLGKIVSVDQVLNPTTRTARARILLEKTKLQARSGTFVTVRIQVPLGSFISIPKDALIDTGAEQFVFLVHPEGQIEPRKVQVQAEGDYFVAISKGLKENSTIVSQSAFLMDSESQLQSVFAAFQKEGKKMQHHHHH